MVKRQPADLTEHRSGPIRIGAQYLDRRLLNAMARVAFAQQQRQSSVALTHQVQAAPDTRPRGTGRARCQPGHRHRPDPRPMHRRCRLGEVGEREHRMLESVNPTSLVPRPGAIVHRSSAPWRLTWSYSAQPSLTTGSDAAPGPRWPASRRAGVGASSARAVATVIRTSRRPSRNTSASSGRNDSPCTGADDDPPVELEARPKLNLT